MAENAQSDILLKLLHAFKEKGVLDQVMLIGSWCLAAYRSALDGARNLPAVRTLDADFLIPSQRELKREVDVPALLRDLGFVQTFYRSSGWVVYDHPALRVEFLTPELGQGREAAHEMKKLHVKAQGLRYLNLLSAYPLKLSYQGFPVLVPEPSAFALQKLIISQRRTSKVKARKDLDTALVLLDYVCSNPKQTDKLKTILKSIPRGWLKTVTALAHKHHSGLGAILLAEFGSSRR